MESLKPKYIAVLHDGELLLVELTQERINDILEKYDSDENMYVACALSEEFGFSVNNVEWSIIDAEKIKCVGQPLNPDQPKEAYIIQHHQYDRYEGGSAPDELIRPFESYDEALMYLQTYTYFDEWDDLRSLDVDEKRGRAEYYDGWLNHVLIIVKI